MKSEVLVLNNAGSPQEWMSQEDAITNLANGKIIYQIGRTDQFVFHGGINRETNTQSVLSVAPIISVKSEGKASKFKPPAVKNRVLFQRDGHLCAYCGRKFHWQNLTRDHIIPKSSGGGDTWNNLISACKYHNNLKDDKSLAEFGMPLLFKPYTPSHAEYLFLKHPLKCLPTQIEYLLDFFPSESRIREYAESLLF